MTKLTFEEAAKIRPPEDVIAELRDTETKSKFDHEKLKAAFAHILSMEMLEMYEDINERCRQASKVLIAQLASKMAGTGGKQYPMECKIINFTGISDFIKESKSKVPNPTTGIIEEVTKTENIPNATVYCICSSPSEGVTADQAPFSSIKIGALRLWGDACRILSTLEKDKTYIIDCSVQPQDEFYKMSKNDDLGVRAGDDSNTAPTKDLITRLYTPIEIPETDYHLGVYQLVHGRIKSCRTTLNKKGKNQGNMTLSDVNAQFGRPEEGAPRSELNVTWWNAPEFCVEYGPGSEVYVMADLVNKGDQYGLSGMGHFIIPILGLPSKTVFDLFDMSSNGTPTPSAPAPSWQASPQPAQQPTQPPKDTKSNVPSPAAVSKW